ncbi:hypothetical protein OSB04_007856 [Centaurea solstitialis]|uniref:Uncharacterized protein n=1 Tax=Centaurea solstitialis TaxID=347529 RepID=A0AA38TYF9_9ASTR|nr:hypothetical protein OSB04_007856 [Centaurea solstitialis]
MDGGGDVCSSGWWWPVGGGGVKRFQNEDHVCKSFLDILDMYKKGHKSTNQVYHEVAALFHHQPDLLDGFTRFLPPSFKIAEIKLEMLLSY